MTDNQDPSLPVHEEEFEESDSDRTMIKGIQDFAPDFEKRQASLIVISGESVGKMFKLTDGEMLIGRSVECAIYLDDEGVSRSHAKLIKEKSGGFSLQDLNSTNGSFLNGTRIQREFLRDGDKIQIGSTCILKFGYQDSVEEAFYEQQYASATRDGLTNIYNKKHFAEQLAKDFAYSFRHNEVTSLIVFDIDHFKKINDTYGHPCGDYVLKELAQVVSNTLRAEDTFARIGGEEFAIFLRQLDEKRSWVLAERVRRTVEIYKFMWEDTRLRVTISLGVATLRERNFSSPEGLMAEADEYLYKAKRDGRNRVASIIR